VKLRPGTRTDIPALARLVGDCDASHRDWTDHLTLPTLEEQAASWDVQFARRGAWVCVAEDDQDGGRIVGAVAYAPAGQLGIAHVSAVFVHPSHWRQGIARRLVTAAEDAMRAEGYRGARLWTLSGSPAEAVYRRLGWQPDGRRGSSTSLGLTTVGYVRDLREQI
jgi:GNAT superfamily N-acetyltransferase